MPRGGLRPNGGRPKGSKTRRTVIKEEAVANRLDPADVLQDLLEMYQKAEDWVNARQIANDLMPYRHHKLQSKQVNVDVSIESSTIVELVVTTREQADAVLARLSDSNGVPRQ